MILFYYLILVRNNYEKEIVILYQEMSKSYYLDIQVSD